MDERWIWLLRKPGLAHHGTLSAAWLVGALFTGSASLAPLFGAQRTRLRVRLDRSIRPDEGRNGVFVFLRETPMIRAGRKVLAMLLIVTITSLTLPNPAQAAMVGTDSALSVEMADDRTRIASLADRAEVQAQLAAYGVSAADVRARVAAMTDEEAASLATDIDDQPAGGIIGAIVLVFLVLLITDILGYTKIFPFTRPIQK